MDMVRNCCQAKQRDIPIENEEKKHTNQNMLLLFAIVCMLCFYCGQNMEACSLFSKQIEYVCPIIRVNRIQKVTCSKHVAHFYYVNGIE